MMSVLVEPSGLECRVENGCGFPATSNTGKSATFSRSSFDGSLLETSMSPSKSPVGPSGLVAVTVMIVEARCGGFSGSNTGTE